MKKFLTILSFLTVLSSSLVTIACKTAKNNKNIIEKQNNENVSTTNTTSRKNAGSKENKKHKKDEEVETKIKDNNVTKPEVTDKTNNHDSNLNSNMNSNNTLEPNNNNEINSNNTVNNERNTLPKNEMPNDEAPREENKPSKETIESKEKIDKLVKEKNNMEISVFFTDLYSVISQEEFNNKWSEKISEANVKVVKLFGNNNSESLKTQINDFVTEVFGVNSKWTDEDKKKLSDILMKTSKENKDDYIDDLDQLFINVTSRETEQEKKAKEEIEKLLNQGDYGKVKKIIYELIDKNEEIQKERMRNNILIPN
ncbi:lipoprotein [Mycoplasma feriruminatoris]|uniref:hypothetical protein n=1 Tax=Mycoplasma feriruminatoris TaxID=1179777 RepID=UPI0024202857|nr:hypothetical protein [Mycoplasma feriruminatoris]WFQ91052.1 lipoprotein [Mycoplasma feriruminatoris]